MKLLDRGNYGRPISEEISDCLRTYTDKHDRADVSIKTGVGTSTIRDVVYRANTMTEHNSKAIMELLRVAIGKCETNIMKSTMAKQTLKSALEQAQQRT